MISHLKQRIVKQTFIKPGDTEPDIWRMSYNTERDELFIADHNHVIHMMRLCNSPFELRDVYAVSYGVVYSVCHMNDSDTLLVCSSGQRKLWLVLLSRNGSNEWREADRLQIQEIRSISCAFSDSRVLIGKYKSKQMELFRVESGPRISLLHRIAITDEYRCFSATSGIDTLVAISYTTHSSVLVHRLRGDQLEAVATHNQLHTPYYLLWLTDRLLITEYNKENKCNSVTEISSQVDRHRQPIAADERIRVFSWCAVHDGIAIFDQNSKDILIYKF